MRGLQDAPPIPAALSNSSPHATRGQAARLMLASHAATTSELNSSKHVKNTTVEVHVDPPRVGGWESLRPSSEAEQNEISRRHQKENPANLRSLQINKNPRSQ